MNDIFNLYTNFSLVYIDDVLIFSNSIEHHFKHLEIFQQVVRENGLVVFAPKIKLFQTRIFDFYFLLSSIILPVKISNSLNYVLGLCPNTISFTSFSSTFGKRIQSQMVVKFLSFYCLTNSPYHQWISSKNAPSKPSPSKTPIQIPLDNFLLSRTSLPSDKEFKKHLKMFMKK